MTNLARNSIIGAGALALAALSPLDARFAEAKEAGVGGTPATSKGLVDNAAVLASLPVPANYAPVREADITVDAVSARLVRYERSDARNAGLGGEHFSAVIEPSGRLKGFTRMDLALRSGDLPKKEDAQAIAMGFLSNHAPDLLKNLSISFIAPHDETVRDNDRSVALTGMKVKMRNTADGRWFWVIVGADRQVMVFERDIVWANLQGRRTTELWLHDSWLARNAARSTTRGS